MEINTYRSLKSSIKGSETLLLRQALENKKSLGKGANAEVLDLLNGAAAKIPKSFLIEQTDQLKFSDFPEGKTFWLQDTPELKFPNIAHGLTSASFEIIKYLEPTGIYESIDFLLKVPGEVLPRLVEGTQLLWGQYRDIPPYQIEPLKQRVLEIITEENSSQHYEKLYSEHIQPGSLGQKIAKDLKSLVEGVFNALKFIQEIPQESLNGLYKAVQELNDRELRFECVPHNCMYDKKEQRFSIIDISRIEFFPNEPSEIGRFFFEITDDGSLYNILKIAKSLYRSDAYRTLEIDISEREIRRKLDIAEKQMS